MTRRALFFVSLLACKQAVTPAAGVNLDSVDQSDFQLQSQDTVVVFAGSTQTWPLHLMRVNGHTLPVTVLTSGLPGSVTASDAAFAQGVNESTITVNAATSASPGSYSVSLRGVGGTEHTVTVTLLVLGLTVDALATGPRLPGTPVDLTAHVLGPIITLASPTFTIDGADVAAAGTASGFTLHTAIPPSLTAGSHLLPLTVHVGDAQTSANVGVEVDTSVSGILLDVGRRPIAGASVRSGTTATTTGANGDFTLGGMVAPYSLTAVQASLASCVVYRNLTRVDPVLSAAESNLKTSTLSFKVQMQDAALSIYDAPSGSVAQWVLNGNEFWLSGQVGPSSGLAQDYDWFWSSTVQGNLHVLQWQKDISGNPTSFDKYGRLLGTGVNAAGPVNMTLPMTQPVTNATVSGSVTVPTGATLGRVTARANFGAGATMVLGDDISGSPTFSLPVPNIAGVTISLQALSIKGSDLGMRMLTGLAPGASGVTIDLPESGPKVSSPVDAATGVSLATPFSWSSAPGIFILQTESVSGPTGCTGTPEYRIVTSDVTTTLPDLAADGVTFPRGCTFEWTVMNFQNYPDVDAMAQATAGPQSLFDNDFVGGQGGYRTFTTSP